MTMTSSRPYLIRALYEWIVDNQLTPHLLVNVMAEGVLVPQEYVKDGQITLNIAPSAVKHFVMGNDAIRFSARFRGIASELVVPCQAVLGIYARENGQGMTFKEEERPTPPAGGSRRQPAASRPQLRVVK